MSKSLPDLITAISQFEVEPSPCPGIGQVFLDKRPQDPKSGRFVLEGGVGSYTEYYVLMSEAAYRGSGAGTRLIRHLTMMDPADVGAKVAFQELIDIAEATQSLDEGVEAQSSGNVSLADAKFSNALDTFCEYPDRSEFPVVLSKLANVRAVQRRVDEARSLYLQTVDAGTRVFGSDDLFTLKSEQALAMIEVNTGHVQAAANRLNRVVRVIEIMHTSDNHNDISSQVLIMSYASLGDVELIEGNLREALTKYQMAIEKGSQLLGFGHPVTQMAASKVQNLVS